MATTTYLRNAAEIAAAGRALKAAGYIVSQREIRENDRYVMNIVSRFNADRRIEDAIVAAVRQVRSR